MSLALPDLDRYRRHLKKALGVVAGSRQVRKVDGLETAIRASTRQLESGSIRDWKLNTPIPWTVPLDWREIQPPATAVLEIGVNIDVRGGRIDQHVVVFSVVATGGNIPVPPKDSCCRHAFPTASRIIRRVHFDIDVARSGDERPRTHLQIGGQLDESLADSPRHYCQDSYLDIPRIPCAPMDPILLLEVLIRQFHPESLASLTEEPDWRGLVRVSEELWLRKHYAGSAAFLSAGSQPGSLYQLHCQDS